MSRRNVLIILVIVLLLIALPLTLYLVKQQTINNTHASGPTVKVPKQSASAPATTTQQQTAASTTDVLLLNGWTQDNVTQATNHSLTITSPLGTNWYYIKNSLAKYNMSDAFTVDFQASATALGDATKPAIAHLHFVNALPLTLTQNSTPPDEVMITRDNNNKLLVSVISFSGGSSTPKIDLVTVSDNIVFPSNGHVKITLAGIASGNGSITIFDGDTGTQLTNKSLPVAVFTQKIFFLELSVQNAANDQTQSIMKVNKLTVTI